MMPDRPRARRAPGRAARARLRALGPVVALAIGASGCLDLGAAPVTVMQGRLMTGPGAVFAERGELWQGSFERGTTFGEDGSFSVEVSGEGPWGFHAYLEGYIYLPLQVQVGSGLPTTVTQAVVDWELLCDRSGRCDWVEQSTNATVLTAQVDEDPTDNPTISAPTVTRAGGGIFQVSLEVFDPDGDLSNQILVQHLASGVAAQLNPPGPIVDDNRPNGTYTGTVRIPEGEPRDGPWLFLAADHACNNSQLLEVSPE